MTPGKQWAAQELPLDAIGQHRDLQFRAGGLSSPHVAKLVRTLEAGGEPLEAVRVARVGKALVLIDGHHRVAAHRKAGKETISAKVARMSLQEAKDAARVANAKHGKGMSRADKSLAWGSYVADGKHLGGERKPRASRVIAEELGQMWSHQTVLTKLRSLGLEIDEGLEFPGGYKPHPYGRDDDDAAAVGDLVAEELEASLRDFGGRFSGLPDWHGQRLLRAAQGMLAALERGEEPDMAGLLQEASPF